MAAVARTFEESIGQRGPTQILLGIVAPSGAGKTKSALRIGTGIQRIVGGDLWVIDTENNRARHYDDEFRFRHLPFKPPFGPSDYEAAIEHCRTKGAKTIIVDSTSHLHEGKGGILQWHAQEVERIMAAWKCSEEKANVPAWHKPKSGLRAFIDYFTQIDCHIIFTFKARDKVKLGGGKVATLGFMPIASDELVFELTAKALLLPGADGVPTLQSNEVGEKMMIKLPGYLRPIFTGASGRALDESIGEQIAKWAAGSGVIQAPSISEYESCASRDAFEALEKRRAAVWRTMPPNDAKDALKKAADAAKARLDAGEAAVQKDVQADLVGDSLTEETALTKIREAQSTEEVDAVMAQAQRVFGADSPLSIDIAANDRKEALAQL